MPCACSFDLLRLGFESALVQLVLFVNPSIGLDAFPVLLGKVTALIMDDMVMHESIDLVEIEKGNHGVAVVLGVEVGIPHNGTDEKVGANGTSVEEVVVLLGHFAVRMLKVAKVVDHGVSHKDWTDPPKGKILKSLLGSSKDEEHGGVSADLGNGSHLELTHNATILAIVPAFEAPFVAAVVDGDTHGREDDPSDSVQEGARDIHEASDVSQARKRNIAESRKLELFTSEVADKLGVLVDVVGIGVVLLVHDTFMSTHFKAKDTNKEEGKVVDPLGLPGIAVEEFVLSRKCKGLELKAIEWVENHKAKGLYGVLHEEVLVELDIQLADGIGRQSHNAQVDSETFESLVVRFCHEPDQDTICW